MTPRPELEWLVPLLAVVFVSVLGLRYWTAIPDPMATSWDADGAPVDANHRVIDVPTGVGITAAVAAVPVAMANRVRSTTSARSLVTGGHVLAVLVAGQRWRTITANAGAASWQEATTTVSATPVFVLAIAVGVLGWWASGHRTRGPDDVAGEAS